MRRRPLLITLVLLLLAATALVAVVATFDLNRHRDRLQALLSSSLKRPVTLGEATFSLRHGPALAITDLRLAPSADSPWEGSAERLYVRLELAPLLRGELRFSAIVLEEPRLRIVLGAGSVPPEPRRWQVAGIRSITLRRGFLAVEDRRDPDRLLHLEIDGVDAKLLDLAAGQSAWLALSGHLRQSGPPARLTLAGDLLPSDDRRQFNLHLGVQLEGFDPAPWLARYLPASFGSEGTVSANLQLSGSPAAGLRITADLSGYNFLLSPPGYPPQPLARAHLAGTWHPRRQGGELADLALRLDGLACRGALQWQAGEEGLQLQADLAMAPLPLPELLRRLPEGWVEPLRHFSAEGEVEISRLHFAGPARTLQRPADDLPLQVEAAVRKLRLRPAAGIDLTEVAFRAEFADGLLQVSRGEGRWHDSPCRFAGTLEHPFSQPELTAEIEGAPESHQLLAFLPGESPAELTIRGPLPFSAQVSGTRRRLLVDLRADLSRLAAAWGEIRKSAGQAGSLLLAGQSSPEGMELSHFRLQLPSLELRGRGGIGREAGAPFTLELDSIGFDLQQARSHWPLLERLRARGLIDLHLRLAGQDGRIQKREGEIRLRGVGVHLTDVIAELQQTEGLVQLSGDRLTSRRLTTRLGSSPLSVEGEADLSRLQAKLQVRGKTVRAEELIFPSPTMLLRDIDGQLRIDRQAIVFEPVTVRLDGGTRAEVRGAVRLQPQPRVALTIEASRGNIDEVIALWQTPGPTPPKKEEDRSDLRVRIVARAAEGELAGMQFHQAEGLITWWQGILSIHPLSFRIDDGRGEGRVVVDSTLAPSLLQVSGHLEGVDAATVHRQLLKRRGLIQGDLQGDFYLEGRLGAGFLESSSGGFSLEIRDGVLNRFNSLAKVFSLLNVSQILTLQLPDMAREGMPFSRLHATFSLAQGVLATEDLLVDSNAMNLSLVGQADLKTDQLDFVLGVKPLRTVDQIVTRIPLAGWILAGEEKALITAHFLIRGSADDPNVVPVPITSVSEKVLGIFRRVFNLPGKVIEEVGELLQ